ncbi:hypothetical protein [Bacillus massiliigorillae]|uniref:hypothetical protein n=1 Tax=Bacillus massiliigorillae TaxID=1243664 RepID=UPI0012B55E5B|nr:hypothetical protein [Bacillus massiliigorillae]
MQNQKRPVPVFVTTYLFSVAAMIFSRKTFKIIKIIPNTIKNMPIHNAISKLCDGTPRLEITSLRLSE